MPNDIDLYWLRSRVNELLPKRLYERFGVSTGEKGNDLIQGAYCVLDLLTEITGVPFNKIG